MKDLYGNELSIGDDVLYLRVSGKTRIQLYRTTIKDIKGSRAYLNLESDISWKDKVFTTTNLIKFLELGKIETSSKLKY